MQLKDWWRRTVSAADWYGRLSIPISLGAGGVLVTLATGLLQQVAQFPTWLVVSLWASLLLFVLPLALLVGVSIGARLRRSHAPKSAPFHPIVFNIGSVDQIDFTTPVHLEFREFGNISTSSNSAIVSSEFEALMVPRGTISRINKAAGPPRIAPPSEEALAGLSRQHGTPPTTAEIRERADWILANRHLGETSSTPSRLSGHTMRGYWRRTNSFKNADWLGNRNRLRRLRRLFRVPGRRILLNEPRGAVVVGKVSAS